MTFHAFTTNDTIISSHPDHTSARRAAESSGPGAYVENDAGIRTAHVPKPYRNFYVDDTPNLIGVPVAARIFS